MSKNAILYFELARTNQSLRKNMVVVEQTEIGV